MRVLIFGKNGQLGRQLVQAFAGYDHHDVIPVGSSEIDLSQTGEIAPFVTRIGADWVINAAAYTAVDNAEDDVERCFSVNAAAPEAMASACAAMGSKLIHYSTDYVFDGCAGAPYKETHQTNPQNVYGRSKLAGEQATLGQYPDAIILRTAWIYSRHGHNFVNSMLRLATERSHLNIVSDQYGSPTSAAELAQVTLEIVRGLEAGRYEHHGGIFHVTGSGQASWYEFCRQIMKASCNDRVTVHPIVSQDYPTRAARPGYSVLDNQKLWDVYGQRLPDWRVSLQQCF